MSNVLRGLWLCVGLLLGSGAWAQDFPMLRFTADNGLPSNTVNQVYRDHKGFLWFATDKGVARYNGLKFEVFTTFNGLPDNDITSFCEDLYSRLWIVTANGGLCYYKDDQFHTAKNTPMLRLPFPTQGTRRITQQKDSSVIVVLNKGTRFLNITDAVCSAIDVGRLNRDGSLGTLIHRRKLAPNRYKLTYTNNTIVTDTLLNIKQKYDVDTFRGEAVGNTQFFTSCQNQDYLFNHQRIYTPDMAYMASFPQDFHKNNYLNRIFFSLSYRFYATNNGLFVNDSIHLLGNCNVSSVSTDRYGNYWVSTTNNGVYVMKSDFMNTRQYADLYEGQALYAFGHRGQFFFATSNNGLYHLAKNTVTTLQEPGNMNSEKPRPNSARAFYLDSSYRYYSIVNHDLSYRKNVFDRRTTVRYIDAGAEVRGLFNIGNHMYAQRPEGITRFNADVDARPANYRNIDISQRDERILDMASDGGGCIWFSTVRGMYKIEDTGRVVIPRKLKGITLKVFDLLGDDMVGYTNTNQLMVLTDVNGHMRIDTIMLENCIWDKLYKIDEEHMLISTNNRYRMLTSEQVNGQHGYQLTVVDDPFIPLQPDGVACDGERCYFLKNGTVTAFNKAALFARPAPPKLFFTELRSVGKTYLIDEDIRVPFREAKSMIILFSTVSFTGSDVIYQYSVSKNDRDYWTEIKGEEISLVNPGSGNYTVKIRAKTTTSDLSQPVEFTLRIGRPFWARWWFILIAIAIVIYIGVFIARQRLNYALSRKDREHDMKVRFMKSEYKALNALMNPHFIFNTLNNVQGLINKNDKLGANEYLRVIADLIRQNMHNISKELIPLQKEIDLVSNYLLLEKLRFKDKLNYTIIVDKGLDMTEIMIPPLLIQPLVENSIKHGILPLENKGGSIFVNIFERKGNLVIEVKDNGVGLSYKKSEQLSTHESFGLDNIRKRIEQLSIIQGKEISFDLKERKNEAGTFHWTVVTIVIPLDE